jgi:hypothetical protein
MKRFKILSLAVMLMMLAFGCYNNDNAITYSVKDVSSRITGLSSDITGAGASLTINGSQLDGAVRVAFGNLVIPVTAFTAVSASSISFNVPNSAPLGTTPIMVVFPGPDRANTQVNVVPVPLITGINPPAGNAGDVLNVYGNNFDNVTAVTIGGTSATITSKTSTQIVATVPSGVATGTVAVSGSTGTKTFPQQFVVCSGAPTDPLCVTPINLNGGFELGTGDNFDNWSKFNGASLLTATTNAAGGEVFSGARALKVSVNGTQGGNEQYRIQLASDLINTTIGTTYTMTAWAKAAAVGGKIRFSTQPNAQYQGDTAVPTTWTLITWTFVANATQTRIVLDLGGAFNTTYFIDEVKLH